MSRGRSLRDFADGSQDGRDDGRDDDQWRADESARYADSRAYDTGSETGYSEALPAYDDTGYSEAMPANRALMPLDDESALLPALIEDETGPVVIPGTGESMGNPFIRRRERPLTMRIAIVTLITCILVTGLFAVTPLGSSADAGASSFQALSGVVVWHKDTSFFWYQAQWGDTTTTVAAHYHVSEGGIYKLNGLSAGQDFTVGNWYKIPTDPNYGADYRPPSLAQTNPGVGTRFGGSLWSSVGSTTDKDTCPPETSGGPKGTPGNWTSYGLKAANPGSWWVRGWSWFHNGVDMAAPAGNPIHAAQSGQVIWAGWDFGGFGNSVKIDHCNGISTVYGHMMRLNVVAGQKVNVGDIVGFEGSTGWSTGPHLHLMVQENNQPVDPFPFYGYSEYNITLNPAYK